MPERPLASYLLLPRPAEARVKAPIVALGYGVVLFGDTTARVPVGTALVACAVFELGLYQTRYMLNDLIDADVDRMHLAAGARGRIPGGARAWRAVLAAVVARLLASVAVVVLLPDRARAVTLAAAAGLAGATVAYEAARTPIRRRRVPPEQARLSLPELAVFGLVGAGYAVRVGFGAALAGAGGGTLAAAIAFGWVHGSMLIVMTWTLEAAGLRAGGGAAVLARKSHIAVLARLLGDDPAALRRPLLGGRSARPAMWLFAGECTLAIVLGVALGWSPGAARLAALLGVCVAAGPVLLARWPSPLAGPAVVAVDVVAAWALAGGGDGDGVLALVALVSVVGAAARLMTPEGMGLAAPAAPAGSAAPSPGAPPPASAGATRVRRQ